MKITAKKNKKTSKTIKKMREEKQQTDEEEENGDGGNSQEKWKKRKSNIKQKTIKLKSKEIVEQITYNKIHRLLLNGEKYCYY